MKKLPLGISTFSEIIEEDYIYVDKTQHIHEMISTGKIYFLSRPRRFGKSLLISTLDELFKGNKGLFKDLYIYDKWDWSEKFPVVKIDLGKGNYDTEDELENILEDTVNRIAREFSVEIYSKSLSEKFTDLVIGVYKKTGKKVVVLIDEYDFPIMDSMKNIKIAKKNQRILAGFYRVLKTVDEYLRFIFLTGVTKFSKTSIFSGLNNLDDITMDSNFSNICGYTQEELENRFREYIDKFSKDKNIGEKKLLSLIKDWYNGYSWDGENQLYNPYSIIYLFRKGIFKNYWFETGTPSFLIDFIKNNPEEVDVLFKEDIEISGDFPNFHLNNIDFTTLLLQTGYLTVKSADIHVGELPSYKLAIPNKEVNISMFTSIIAEFSKQSIKQMNNLASMISNAIFNLDNDSLQFALDTLIATIPAIQYGKVKKDIREANYHILLLSWFRLMGFFALGEAPASKKTPDIIIKKDNLVLVCELKYGLDQSINDLAIDAITQIKDNEYYKPYLDYDVVLLGLGFGEREVKSVLEPLKK